MRMQSCKKQDWNSPSGQGWSVHLQSSISHLISKKKKKQKNSFASLWKRPCMNYWCEWIEFREVRRPSAPSSAERTGTALTETDTSQDSSVLPLWNVLPLHCSCCFSVLMATTTRLGMRGRSVHAGGLYAPAPGFHPTLCTGWQEAGTGQPNAEIFSSSTRWKRSWSADTSDIHKYRCRGIFLLLWKPMNQPLTAAQYFFKIGQ